MGRGGGCQGCDLENEDCGFDGPGLGRHNLPGSARRNRIQNWPQINTDWHRFGKIGAELRDANRLQKGRLWLERNHHNTISNFVLFDSRMGNRFACQGALKGSGTV